MNTFGHTRVRGIALVVFAALGPTLGAVADDKVVGEIWHQTISAEMTNIAIPPRTVEVCVPVGEAMEVFSNPQRLAVRGVCSVQDARRAGNRFTARMICTGEQAGEGTIDTLVDGDHLRAKVTMEVGGQEATITSEGHRIGTPCTPTR